MIQVGENWRVGADPHNIILYKRNGKGNFVADAYFGTVKAALERLVDQEVRDTELVDLRVVLARLDTIYSVIDSLPPIRARELLET